MAFSRGLNSCRRGICGRHTGKTGVKEKKGAFFGLGTLHMKTLETQVM